MNKFIHSLISPELNSGALRITLVKSLSLQPSSVFPADTWSMVDAVYQGLPTIVKAAQ
jgi:hypothetical protein